MRPELAAPRKYGASIEVETAIVGGKKMKYIPGDTTPPPRIRRCRRCNESYASDTGKTCGCWEIEYREHLEREKSKEKP
jgi:hypothetical protein